VPACQAVVSTNDHCTGTLPSRPAGKHQHPAAKTCPSDPLDFPTTLF